MKSNRLGSLFLLLCFTGFGALLPALAQSPPPPASSPASTDAGPASFVCLKQEYADGMRASGLPLQGNLLAARFQGFDNDFALFRLVRREETIYIPKMAIICISGKRPATGITF